MTDETLDNPVLEAAVANVVDRVEALYTIGEQTGLDVTFAIKKEFATLSKSLRVHALRRVADRRVVAAKKYQQANKVLSGDCEAKNVFSNR